MGKIKYQIKTINGGKEPKYGNHFMKIRFESDYNMRLNKTLKHHKLTVIVRSVFEDSKYSLQFFFR